MMLVWFEETVTNRCEIEVDPVELLECESLEEYVAMKQKDRRGVDVYESRVSTPTTIETKRITDEVIDELCELMDERGLNMKPLKEYIEHYEQ